MTYENNVQRLYKIKEVTNEDFAKINTEKVDLLEAQCETKAPEGNDLYGEFRDKLSIIEDLIKDASDSSHNFGKGKLPKEIQLQKKHHFNEDRLKLMNRQTLA